ncbi:DUF928 domain-containing protein [Geitlerinema splendidum]|nr:DUF928 domain-containing protein [Geitlerinema splendidum]
MYWLPKHLGMTVVGLASFLYLSGVGLPQLVLAQMWRPNREIENLPSREKQAILRLSEKQQTNPRLSQSPQPPPRRPVVPPLNPNDNPQTSPGSVRDTCVVGQKPLTAVIPVTDRQTALTISAYPTFFVYVPETRAQEAEFILVDTIDDSVAYQTRVQLPKTAGVMSLSLPRRADVTGLQAQKSYRWTFALVCKAENGEENTGNFVNGNIQRVNRPDVEMRAREASVQEVPSIYAKEGFWHDLLASLAQLRRDSPNNAELADSWARLLSDVGLADVAGEPLVSSRVRPSIR